MGDLFSLLTKQVLGLFLISAGLPAIALVLGLRILVAPAIPVDWSRVLGPELVQAEWQVGLMVTAALIVASVLAGLNGPIIRLFEGYPLRSSRLGEWLRKRHETRVREAEHWWRGTRAVLRTIDQHAARSVRSRTTPTTSTGCTRSPSGPGCSPWSKSATSRG